MQFDDPVSALTLTGAAERVLSDFQPQDAKVSDGYHSIKAFLNEFVKAEDHKKVASEMRFAYDQLRHAHPLREHEHVINIEGVEMLILMAVWAYAGKPMGDQQASLKWFYELPPTLSAFTIWMFLNYSSGTWDKRPDNNFPELRALRSNPTLEFNELVDSIQSKSLFPNPKSPTEQPLP